MSAFDKAWTVLKDDFIEDERDPNDPDQRKIIAWGEGDESNPEERHGIPIFQPHSKEEILDLMVQHGALVGRMPHEIGSPEWSENMDDLESTGVFDSLEHHYANDESNKES